MTAQDLQIIRLKQKILMKAGLKSPLDLEAGILSCHTNSLFTSGVTYVNALIYVYSFGYNTAFYCLRGALIWELITI